MKIQAEIKAIGANAIDSTEPMVILFNEQATPALKEIALIQQFADLHPVFNLTTGATVTIDQHVYQATYIGALTNENLNTIGHVTLVFDQVPDGDRLQGGLYLAPMTSETPKMPTFKVGTQLSYQINE
ncbi:PTS glucitol/sorbitol transporter subunit IIA [Latilactobacillus fuchuensis]|uniref:PTS glucitol/sorbitol transporter subunit IIA n=1 Tax=Latilactobacillus fuchuensis TaxID=164393 RepID=UPI0020C7C260|nr:PTS glucitol/sorbitol transporter subunit IIA [Latilactobacillus fuchuensis]MCP8857117.1 PTS glucitol/sorbitol transporter subunit IIA [Latilactobacillus fuchuensis]